MENVILIIVLAAILGGAIAYIVIAKKRGVKCIGCPSGGSCGQKKGSSCSGCSGCSGGSEGCGCGCSYNGEAMQENGACHKETE